MILVDTSVLIDHLRGRTAARDAIRRALESDETLIGSVLTRVVILGPMRTAERPSVRAVLSLLTWLPVTEQIADDAGLLARTYRRSHASIDVIDYVLAATAQLNGATLWTRNVRHFPMFDGLVAPY